MRRQKRVLYFGRIGSRCDRRQSQLLLACIIVSIILLHNRIRSVERFLPLDQEDATAPNKVLDLEEKHENTHILASRAVNEKKRLKLSHFLPTRESSFNPTTATPNITLAEATKGRGPILDILLDAGIHVGAEDISSILMLPMWQQVAELYGDQPVILGLDQCEAFRTTVPLRNRFLGIAGNFNSGTTAFGQSLQANCKFPHRRHQYKDDPFSNDKVTHVNGMLSQVPWAKHKMAIHRDNHTILETVPKLNVLPIVLVRDPYFWMQSMCKEGYGVRWDHSSTEHCPNLIPNAYDKRRFGKKWARRQQQQQQRNNSSIRVWMGANPQVGPSWDSLVHYWNAWYESYYQTGIRDFDNWPRLIIRFEDTLFHPKQVMKAVCQCGGGQLSQSNFQYLLHEAKWNHKQAQNNFVTAMVKYGNAEGRYRNMTSEDLAFAKESLNSKLMEAFHYRF